MNVTNLMYLHDLASWQECAKGLTKQSAKRAMIKNPFLKSYTSMLGLCSYIMSFTIFFIDHLPDLALVSVASIFMFVLTDYGQLLNICLFHSFATVFFSFKRPHRIGIICFTLWFWTTFSSDPDRWLSLLRVSSVPDQMKKDVNPKYAAQTVPL